MRIKTVDQSKLIEDPNNEREHGEENLRAIRESIVKFGQVEPLVVRESTMQVIGGNGRLAAMRSLGIKKVKIVFTDGTDDEMSALRIALNRTGELATWTKGKLAETLRGLREREFDFSSLPTALPNLSSFTVGEHERDVVRVPKVKPPPPPPMPSTSEVIVGDMRKVLATVDECSFDSCVTDPPYGLSREADINAVLGCWMAGEEYIHGAKGFMGRDWDSFVPGPEYWREVFRVLKPGAHLVAFAGTRTYDLMVIAIRMAGFEIRDQVGWVYATGFPKSLDVSKAIDDAAGVERIIVNTRNKTQSYDDGQIYGGGPGKGGIQIITAPATDDAKKWDGWGTALKPAIEPAVLARKPLSGTVAANVVEHGTGGINVDGCRVGEVGGTADKATGDGVKPNEVYGTFGACKTEQLDAGRWPANIALDESAAAELDKQEPGADRFFYVAKPSRAEREIGCEYLPPKTGAEATDRTEDSDGLSSPRAGQGRTSSEVRNWHPTVKPVRLMQHLVKLVTPPGGKVLDPFVGSGTTGIAAALEGFSFTGIEMDEQHADIASARISSWERYKKD